MNALNVSDFLPKVGSKTDKDFVIQKRQKDDRRFNKTFNLNKFSGLYYKTITIVIMMIVSEATIEASLTIIIDDAC